MIVNLLVLIPAVSSYGFDDLGDYTPPPMFGEVQGEMHVALADLSDMPVFPRNSVAFPLEIKTRKKNGIPLPPKRPDKFHASESFIRDALTGKDELMVPRQAVKAAPVQESLESQLINLSPQELLKYLD